MQPPDCDGQIRNNDGEHEQSGQQPTAVVKPGRSAPASLFRPPLRRSEAEGGIDEAQDEHPNDHEQDEHPELFRPGSAGELRIALERPHHPWNARATSRARVCRYVSLTEVTVSLKKKTIPIT